MSPVARLRTPKRRAKRVEPVQAKRVAGAAAKAEREMGAVPENLGRLGPKRPRPRVRLVGDECRDQAVRTSVDILPVEEALTLLAFLPVGAVLAHGEQAGEPRPAGTILRPDQEGGAVHQIEPAAGDETDAGRLGGAQGMDKPADTVAVGDPQRGWPSRAAAENNSSALETPRRKLKWLVT